MRYQKILREYRSKNLENLISTIQAFLRNELRLELHPNKVYIKTLASGVDFLGWMNFTDHKVLRTVTKRRMFARIKEREKDENTVQSYLGLLSHGNAKKLKDKLLE